jgi:hypothetical protein
LLSGDEFSKNAIAVEFGDEVDFGVGGKCVHEKSTISQAQLISWWGMCAKISIASAVHQMTRDRSDLSMVT